jgi:hypothetical protein
MKTDIPLTDLFECPSCGFRGLFKAEPAAYVKCICGRWWVIGDYRYWSFLTPEAVCLPIIRVTIPLRRLDCVL